MLLSSLGRGPAFFGGNGKKRADTLYGKFT